MFVASKTWKNFFHNGNPNFCTKVITRGVRCQKITLLPLIFLGAESIYQRCHSRQFLPQQHSETLKIISVNFGKYVGSENWESSIKFVQHIWEIFFIKFREIHHSLSHTTLIFICQKFILFLNSCALVSHFTPKYYWNSWAHPNHGFLKALRTARTPFESPRPCHYAAIDEHNTKGEGPRWTALPPSTNFKPIKLGGAINPATSRRFWKPATTADFVSVHTSSYQYYREK